MAKPSKYDMSTDYQLPNGELWWLIQFKHKLGYEYYDTLFSRDEVKTWYQANQHADILIREILNLKDSKTPAYIVKLWNPETYNS